MVCVVLCSALAFIEPGTSAMRVDGPPPIPAEQLAAEYEKLGGRVVWQSPEERTLGIVKTSDQPAPVALLRKPAAGVRRVVLQGFAVTNDDLETLTAWPELEAVKIIDGKRVSDRGVRALARLPHLRALSLADTSVTGNGLEALSGHRALTRLEVTNTIVDTRVHALRLKNIPRLERLLLNAEGMASWSLANMPRLRELEGPPLTLESAELVGLGALRDLDFHGTRLGNLTLTGMPRLATLDVRRTLLGGKAIASLRRALPDTVIKSD